MDDIRETGLRAGRCVGQGARLSSLRILVAGLSIPWMACQKPASVPVESGAGGSECPEGQTFDGQFCRTDRENELRKAEAPTPVPPEPQPSPSTGPAEPGPAPTEASAAATGGAPPTEEPSEGASIPSGGAGAEAPGPADRATPVDVSMAAQAGPLITYLAGSHLPPGAHPLGVPFAAQFAEGQIFEQRVQLTVGRCYTVVAAGIHPVRSVDIELLEEGGKEPLASDGGMGPQAVLGSRNGCFKPQRPDLILVVRVSKGQGVVAGQVFEK